MEVNTTESLISTVSVMGSRVTDSWGLMENTTDMSSNATGSWMDPDVVLPVISLKMKVNLIYQSWYPAIITWFYMFQITGIPGHLLLQSAFIKDPGLRTPTNCFICSQSVANLVGLLAGQLFAIMNYTKTGIRVVTSSKTMCLFSLGMAVFTMMASLTSLLILSVERFIAVVFPYRYYCVITDRSVSFIIAAKWWTIFCIASMPILGWNIWQPGKLCYAIQAYSPTYTIYFYLMPVITMIIIITILNTIISYIAFIKKRITPQSGLNVPSTNQHNVSDYKVTLSFLKVISVFYLTWAPYIVLTALVIRYPALGRGPQWFRVIHELSKGMLSLNAVCNPYFYAKGNFKWKRVLYKWRGRQEEQ